MLCSMRCLWLNEISLFICGVEMSSDVMMAIFISITTQRNKPYGTVDSNPGSWQLAPDRPTWTQVSSLRHPTTLAWRPGPQFIPFLGVLGQTNKSITGKKCRTCEFPRMHALFVPEMLKMGTKPLVTTSHNHTYRFGPTDEGRCIFVARPAAQIEKFIFNHWFPGCFF